jgi:hypothetical protein
MPGACSNSQTRSGRSQCRSSRFTLQFRRLAHPGGSRGQTGARTCSSPPRGRASPSSGANEKLNGLLRQYFPKRANLGSYNYRGPPLGGGTPQQPAPQDPRLGHTRSGTHCTAVMMIKPMLRRPVESALDPRPTAGQFSAAVDSNSDTVRVAITGPPSDATRRERGGIATSSLPRAAISSGYAHLCPCPGNR